MFGVKKRILDAIWKWQVKQKLGIEAAHLNLNYYKWHWAAWKPDDMKEWVNLCGRGQKNNHHGVVYLIKILSELKNTDRNTTIKPIWMNPEILNKLTYGGMNDIAKNRLGLGSNQNSHLVLGDNGTGVLETDTQLYNQTLAKDFASFGSRNLETSSRTEQYAMPIISTYWGASPPYPVREFGLATGSNPPTAVLVSRSTTPLINVNAGVVYSCLITVAHENGAA